MKKNKLFILIIVVIVLVILGVFSISFIVFNQNSIDNEELEEYNYIDEDGVIDEEGQAYIIGQELYDKALEIYEISPYCGKKYGDISKSNIITENNISYYKTDYTNVNQINNEVSKYFVKNPFSSIQDYIVKNKKIYCKYVSSVNTKNFLGQYYLDLIDSSDNSMKFEVTTVHLGPVHKKSCTIDTPLDCSPEEGVSQKSSFVIVKSNNEWKISEFHNPYY